MTLRKALDAFDRADDTDNLMRTLNILGNVDRTSGHDDAALRWFEQSLALAEQVGDILLQASVRGNRAIVWSDQAQAADDPAERQRLLNRAIAEERATLAFQEQLGHPAGDPGADRGRRDPVLHVIGLCRQLRSDGASRGALLARRRDEHRFRRRPGR